jgi:hypothetical protein
VRGLFRLQRVVDNDDVGRTPSQHAADRGGEPAALGHRLELGHRLPLRREAGGKELPVPVAGDDLPAIARQFVGEVLRVADAEELRARVMTEGALIVEQKVGQPRLVDLATIRPNRGGPGLNRSAVDDDPAASSPCG